MKDIELVRNCFKSIGIEVKELDTGFGVWIEIDEWIDLIPYITFHEARTISGKPIKQCVIKWDVKTTTTIPAKNYSDGIGVPEDILEQTVVYHVTLMQAVKKAWKLIGNEHIEQIFADEDFARMNEEQEKLEKDGAFICD